MMPRPPRLRRYAATSTSSGWYSAGTEPVISGRWAAGTSLTRARSLTWRDSRTWSPGHARRAGTAIRPPRRRASPRAWGCGPGPRWQASPGPAPPASAPAWASYGSACRRSTWPPRWTSATTIRPPPNCPPWSRGIRCASGYASCRCTPSTAPGGRPRRLRPSAGPPGCSATSSASTQDPACARCTSAS